LAAGGLDQAAAAAHCPSRNSSIGDRVVGEAGEDIAEVGLGVEAVQGRGLDQGVEDGGPATAGIGARDR
jgi:hypothetical protein